MFCDEIIILLVILCDFGIDFFPYFNSSFIGTSLEHGNACDYIQQNILKTCLFKTIKCSLEACLAKGDFNMTIFQTPSHIWNTCQPMHRWEYHFPI